MGSGKGITERTVRVLLHFGYFVVAYIVLFLYASEFFCSPYRGEARAIISAKLALACRAWDIFVDACGAVAIALTGTHRQWLQIRVSTLVAGFGFASAPSWIYRGYGHFLFENTWAEVSCFFIEGYGVMFPMVSLRYLPRQR